MHTRFRLLFFLSAVILLTLTGVFWYQNGLRAVSSEAEDKTIVIAQGDSVQNIADTLKGAGLIRSTNVFRLYVKLQGVQSDLQAGTYVLNTDLSVAEITERLSDGDVLADEILVRLREGLTKEQIAQQLGDAFAEVQDKSADELRKTFLLAFNDANRPYDFLADVPVNGTLEGFLFPDTYRFFKNATAEDVTVKLLDTFAEKVPVELRAEADQYGYSFYEMLTLASIIEKELQKTEDRRLAADLFLRRLEIGQALQSDVTVKYVTGNDGFDTSVDSPYNTYKYQGLPPGPISNPGLDAITSALQPIPNEYYYFLTDADDVAHFAKTFAEHSVNVQKYLE
ncbi:MAG: endolytic transglycosylase MltG [Candidatus Nomurabacteria bacterium]|nr:MAG: endolytic transglycosylase MltG [Candidatus Nomurabacteria bacterium]